MAEPSPVPTQQTEDAASTPVANGTPVPTDIDMVDALAPQDQTQTLQPAAALQASVVTATPTPTPVIQPPPVSSRNSPHPSVQAPTQPIPHGSPTRVYLNQNVTPHLLEAMKHLATTEPEKPLKWLSEFLAMKSAEIEG
ncbi:hypothetical protein GQ44DRAFT_696379 [Phaeosphaeriaceae sp. PMI808]|nr:hypothetical protein GQ44DRAFT_696379 [Phaeosphaeriaceae sp. PMI808]